MAVSYNLLVRCDKAGQPYWEAKWRDGGRQFKRRLGVAWLVADGESGWERRPGRPPADALDERRAHASAVEMIARVAGELAERERLERERANRPVTVRELAHEWLRWLEEVRRVKPATLRDYGALLREPGIPYKRGTRVTHGRLMGGLGDRPIRQLRTRDVSAFLRALDDEGLSARNVNKHRQVLAAMFQYACREDTHGLEVNPVLAADKRPEPPPAALDYYEFHEVQALADVTAAGDHRHGVRDELDRRIDEQDAEFFWILFFTGLRLGEAVTLRWSDVDLESRTVLVRRGLSAGVETIPKGRRYRYVPLAAPAVQALRRLAARGEFLGPDDYVFANVWGRRLDESAIRRRYKRACATAGLRPMKLHGLRHAAGSIVARTADPVFVRDMLGHAKLTTTDRYLAAKFRPEEYARLDAAFARPADDGSATIALR
ncbi:MAG: tyrosine-type recombinase/integrase [Thermoleophilia bacterium]